MKKYLAIFFGFLPAFIYSQVRDDFSDGNLNENLTWFGDTSQFEVNSSKQLHLKSAGTDTSILATPDTTLPDTEWDFWIKLSFNTSANNYSRIYLISDVPDLKGLLNGYYLQVGGANDSLSLIRQTGTGLQTLIKAQHVFTGNSINIMRIKTILDSTGMWRLFVDQTGGINFIDEGTYHGIKVYEKSWFGIYVRYTSSNATKFYFDDFYEGPVIVDTVPPAVKIVRFLTDLQIEIAFSKNITKTSAETPSNYYLKTIGRPFSAILDSTDLTKVRLNFQQHLSSGFCDTLFIKNIYDLAGNTLQAVNSPICYYVTKTHDILINEIMPDPDPLVGLPDCEYVELLNRTRFPIWLNDWTFSFGNYSKTFPDVKIDPHGFLTLTKGRPLAEYGPTVDLFTSATSLSNEGTTLTLKDNEGSVIHSVTYSPEWFGDPLKSNGGWALEQIDPGNPCGCSENWKASTDIHGGTPGKINSSYDSNPDITAPILLRSWISGENELSLLFSESMDSISLHTLNKWTTDPTEGAVDSVKGISPDFREVRLFFPNHFNKDTLYKIIQRTGPIDCVGNELDTTVVCLVGMPDFAILRDIIINEILPDPETNGERFVELFNRSRKIIDLKQLILSSFDSITNELVDYKEIISTSFLLFPGDYLVLTHSTSDIMNRYATPGIGHFIQMSTFPSYTDDHGIVVLARKNDQTVIDKVTYVSDMQYPLLNTTQGVSLERLHPEGRSEDRGNWHSASESSGFATPGYKNSQFQEDDFSGGEITISPEVFTPDNNGLDDILNIDFNMDSPGYLVNLSVFDSKGMMVRQLVRNQLLGIKDRITWNGIDDNHQMVTNGIYILQFELLNPEGKVWKLKKVSVATR